MGDAFKRAQDGQPLVIPAAAYNSFLDAAQDFKKRQQSRGRDSLRQFHQADLFPLRNESGADLSQFGVVGISAPIITPTDNEDEFRNRVSLKGVAPANPTHLGRFAVLQEPAAYNEIATAAIAGVTVCKLYVDDEDHDRAEIADGQTGYLVSNYTGSATILWKEAGTGEKWGIVRLLDPIPERCPIELGGYQLAHGSGASQSGPTFGYDVEMAEIEWDTTANPYGYESRAGVAIASGIAYGDASVTLERGVWLIAVQAYVSNLRNVGSPPDWNADSFHYGLSYGFPWYTSEDSEPDHQHNYQDDPTGQRQTEFSGARTHYHTYNPRRRDLFTDSAILTVSEKSTGTWLTKYPCRGILLPNLKWFPDTRDPNAYIQLSGFGLIASTNSIPLKFTLSLNNYQAPNNVADIELSTTKLFLQRLWMK